MFKLLFVFLFLCQSVFAAPSVDPRYCGQPTRDASGKIIRSSIPLRQFEAAWPKPKDGLAYYRDHVIPLACGGCDSQINLQWLNEEQWRAKSKTERKIYGGNNISEGCP